jgi:hypothetical protein
VSLVTDSASSDRVTRYLFNLSLQDFIWTVRNDNNEMVWAVVEREVLRSKERLCLL